MPHAQQTPGPFVAEKTPARKLLEKLFDLFLKNNNNGDQDDGKETLKDRRGQQEIQLPCKTVGNAEHKQADDGKPCSRPFEPDQKRVDDQGHENNIQNTGNSY